MWARLTITDDTRGSSGRGAIVRVSKDAVLSTDTTVPLPPGELVAAGASAPPARRMAAHAPVTGYDAGNVTRARLGWRDNERKNARHRNISAMNPKGIRAAGSSLLHIPNRCF